MKKSLILGGMLILTLLAACGGSSDSNADPNATAPGVGAVNIDKYVGNWSSCFAAGTGSKQETVILTKFNDSKTTVVFLATEFSYASSDCSGAATMTYSTGTMVFNGSKSLGVDTVDKAIVNAEGAAPEKQVYLIKGTGPVTLTSGRIGGDVDADGYPTTLEGNSLTKQGAALEKYLGTWRSCVASGNGSEEEILTLTKATDSSAYFSLDEIKLLLFHSLFRHGARLRNRRGLPLGGDQEHRDGNSR